MNPRSIGRNRQGGDQSIVIEQEQGCFAVDRAGLEAAVGGPELLTQGDDEPDNPIRANDGIRRGRGLASVRVYVTTATVFLK